jgi:hypothetical protein
MTKAQRSQRGVWLSSGECLSICKLINFREFYDLFLHCISLRREHGFRQGHQLSLYGRKFEIQEKVGEGVCCQTAPLN